MLTEFLKAYSDLPELNGLSDTLALVGLDSEHEAQLVRTILINGLCSGIKTYARNPEYAGAVHLLSLSDALTVLERLFEPEEEIVPAVPVRESAKVQMEPEAPVIEAEPEPVIEPVQEEERIPDHKEEPSSEPLPAAEKEETADSVPEEDPFPEEMQEEAGGEEDLEVISYAEDSGYTADDSGYTEDLEAIPYPDDLDPFEAGEIISEPEPEPVQEEKSVVDDLEALASLNSQTTAVRAAGRAGNGPGFHGRK